MTQAIQDAYFRVGTGEDPAHPEWRTGLESIAGA